MEENIQKNSTETNLCAFAGVYSFVFCSDTPAL